MKGRQKQALYPKKKKSVLKKRVARRRHEQLTELPLKTKLALTENMRRNTISTGNRLESGLKAQIPVLPPIFPLMFDTALKYRLDPSYGSQDAYVLT